MVEGIHQGKEIDKDWFIEFLNLCFIEREYWNYRGRLGSLGLDLGRGLGRFNSENYTMVNNEVFSLGNISN